jgi:propanol-preferring alcohol dehydrogenase
MRAMLLREINSLKQNPTPLSFEEIEEPKPSSDEILIRVTRCGVCHTELDEIEGRTPPPQLPIVLGHQVVGIVEDGENKGQRLGIAWIASACGHCQHCLSGNEYRQYRFPE